MICFVLLAFAIYLWLLILLGIKINFIFILLVCFTLQVKSQNEKQKWVAGISLASAQYLTALQETFWEVNMSVKRQDLTFQIHAF